MPFQGWTDAGFDRELAKFSPQIQEQVLAALGTLANSPFAHPKLARLHGSEYPASFRFRVGSLRVLGLVLAPQEILFLTTVFQKKRDSDYDQALQRHEKRLTAQGPPLADFLMAARRKR